MVKTQLTRLVEKMNPLNIYILSPVMYKDAQKNLQKEFPESISNKFEFLTFAIDTSKDAQGSVLPGVGGMIYPKLGLGDIHEKIDIYPILSKNE